MHVIAKKTRCICGCLGARKAAWDVVLVVLSESTEFTLELTEFQTRGGDTQRGHTREAPITCRAVSRLLSLPCTPQSGPCPKYPPCPMYFVFSFLHGRFFSLTHAPRYTEMGMGSLAAMQVCTRPGCLRCGHRPQCRGGGAAVATYGPPFRGLTSGQRDIRPPDAIDMYESQSRGLA